MTAVSQQITQLQATAWNDWLVTRQERNAILRLLRSDRDMPATVRDLQATGELGKLLANFMAGGGPPQFSEAAELAQILGAGSGLAAGGLIEGWPNWPLRLQFLFRLSNHAQANFRQLGARFAARTYNPAGHPDLLPSGSDAARQPFGGVGATGVPATAVSVQLGDQWRLLRGDSATEARYRNPIPGSLPGYLASLTPAQRRNQARHLLIQPINTVVPFSYLGGRPSRADVLRVAGAAYRLQPALVAAFILAEQRDQSRNEDAVEYSAATNILKQANTSIGLGQVVVSTAKREDLFSRLLGPFRMSLTHDQLSELLVSEEFNIFAVAKYIRLVADRATKQTMTTLPNTNAKFPGMSFSAFGRASSDWPLDNIRALGSEYTSKPWDDRLSPGWGDFVYEAYNDMTRSGVF